LIVELAQARGCPSRLVVTLQLEVARRLMAGPGDSDYGVLTLLVQMSYEPVEWFKIPAGCFFPEPDVDSACVVLRRRATALVPETERARFIKIVKRGFSQRRKMMLKLLKQDWPAEQLAVAFDQIGLSAQIRAEAVSLEQFARLTECLSGGPRGVASTSEEIFDVVNERDEVIGQQARGEVHRLGLRHRAVHVLVFNTRGEVFLQKRSQFKDTFPGAWDSSASGHLNSGEDYDACAVREVREELGLELGACPERILRIEACVETAHEFVWVYRCEAEGPFVLPPEEIERGDWFAPDAATNWMAERPGDFASALLLIWKLWRGGGQA
jgi:16S rRNA (adenine1518-N6/adenine1519-N6)-dimethyltransferase